MNSTKTIIQGLCVMSAITGNPFDDFIINSSTNTTPCKDTGNLLDLSFGGVEEMKLPEGKAIATDKYLEAETPEHSLAQEAHETALSALTAVGMANEERNALFDLIKAQSERINSMEKQINELQKQVEMSVKVGPSGYVFGEEIIPKLENQREVEARAVASTSPAISARDKDRAQAMIAQIDEDIKWRKENPTTFKLTKSELNLIGSRSEDRDYLCPERGARWPY